MIGKTPNGQDHRSAHLSNKHCDFLIIGAGIAGASAAARLAEHGSVIVLERESQPGYHSTGRSAAIWDPSYGSHDVRKLVLASEKFLRNPPNGYSDGSSFLSPRGFMAIFRADQKDLMEQEIDDLSPTSPDLRVLSQQDTLDRVPILDPDHVATSLYSDLTHDIDVHRLHQGYLHVMKAHNGVLAVDAEVTAISHSSAGGDWQVETSKAGIFAAPVLINAAGAWCDEMAKLAGVSAPLDWNPDAAMPFSSPGPRIMTCPAGQWWVVLIRRFISNLMQAG